MDTSADLRTRNLHKDSYKNGPMSLTLHRWEGCNIDALLRVKHACLGPLRPDNVPRTEVPGTFGLEEIHQAILFIKIFGIDFYKDHEAGTPPPQWLTGG
ncbi:hypothetical protein CEK26_012984 [Fusarium fujikuroi]|nr:hypothetical protein CEK27_012997 [Fusarium fujikuroi]QGI86394.1 hypothetical protein CEK25_013123 [Fusarium fujikuroi]QGI99915.1 hypothetical protein CEK26_012984 [Fusarium fujikuroi]VZI13953.1 unnamed protein product [Fusarium fujikuroi]